MAYPKRTPPICRTSHVWRTLRRSPAWRTWYRRGTESASVVCAVQDGAEWLQGLVDVLRPDAVRILDFPHAVEHLTAAAQASLGIGTSVLTAWLDQQAHTLKRAADGIRQVLTALARL